MYNIAQKIYLKSLNMMHWMLICVCHCLGTYSHQLLASATMTSYAVARERTWNLSKMRSTNIGLENIPFAIFRKKRKMPSQTNSRTAQPHQHSWWIISASDIWPTDGLGSLFRGHFDPRTHEMLVGFNEDFHVRGDFSYSLQQRVPVVYKCI